MSNSRELTAIKIYLKDLVDETKLQRRQTHISNLIKLEQLRLKYKIKSEFPGTIKQRIEKIESLLQ